MVLTPNPYRPGAGTTPAYLAGRDAILHDAQAVLENIRVGFPVRSVIYYGLRGVGKTVLLNRIGEMAEDMDVPAEYMEIAERAHSFQADLVLRVYKLMSKLEVSEKLGAYKENDMTELFLALGRFAQRKERGVVFLMDAIQSLNDRDFEMLMEALHRVSQKGYPLAVFATGSSEILRLAGDIKPYAERLFQFVSI